MTDTNKKEESGSLLLPYKKTDTNKKEDSGNLLLPHKKTSSKPKMSLRSHSTVTIESLDSSHKNQGKQRSFVDSYWRVWSSVRLLFSVANHTLPHRLMTSMVPPLGISGYRNVYTDLKGPTLILATLTAILLYGVKTPGRTLAWALVITTRLTFGYWLIFSALASVIALLCRTRLSPLQLLAISGYSLSGHCLVLLIAELLHQEASHTVFFLLTIVFGGLATGRLVVVALTCTPGPPQRLILGSTLASIHLLHLVYIHFACMRNKFAI